MGRNVSLLVEPGRNIEVCDCDDRNKSRSVELGQNLDFRSLGRTWSKHKCFGRAGRNLSRLVEPGRNLEVCGQSDRNISR